MDKPANGYRLVSLERRVEVIEATEPQVIASKLDDLEGDVKDLRRALYTFAFSVLGGAVLFALTVFALPFR